MSLRNLEQGAIFFAVSDFGAHAICLATDVGDTVRARVVTTQLALTFDPNTGRGNSLSGDYPCWVTSTEAPPSDIQDTLLHLDRRYQQGGETTLSKVEIHALTALEQRFDKSGLSL